MKTEMMMILALAAFGVVGCGEQQARPATENRPDGGQPQTERWGDLGEGLTFRQLVGLDLIALGGQWDREHYNTLKREALREMDRAETPSERFLAEEHYKECAKMSWESAVEAQETRERIRELHGERFLELWDRRGEEWRSVDTMSREYEALVDEFVAVARERKTPPR